MRRFLLFSCFCAFLMACSPSAAYRLIQILPSTGSFEASSEIVLQTAVGIYEELFLPVCSGEIFRFRIGSNANVNEADDQVMFWLELPAEEILYYGQINSTEQVYELPVEKSGEIFFRLITPYKAREIRIEHNLQRSEDEQAPCQRNPARESELGNGESFDEAASLDLRWNGLELPDFPSLELVMAGRIVLYSVVRVELHWGDTVDLDLSSQWLGQSLYYSWRQPGYYVGPFYNGLETDVNNVCYSASQQNVEQFSWIVPRRNALAAMENLHFFIDFYDDCNPLERLTVPYRLVYVIEDRRHEEGRKPEEAQIDLSYTIDGGQCGIEEGARISFSLGQILANDSCEHYQTHEPLPRY